MSKNKWYDLVRAYTEQLVRLRSVSPGPGEVEIAQTVLDLLREGDVTYTASGLDLIANDPYQRRNVYAFLQGRSDATIVLLGHFDTVDTQDYGSLAPWALSPDDLAQKLDLLLPTEQQQDHSDWLFGRGVADMKSGIAVGIALMRRLAQDAQLEPLPVSVVMLATPDEENESAGVLQGVHFLAHLRAQHGLRYLGALNIDYVTALYPGDTHRYIYAGSIGKLLPGFLCIGKETHAGLPFHGLDADLLAAELIHDISMNDKLCDAVTGQVAAPPVTLHAADLKTHYDVQLPFATYFYMNVLTLTSTPQTLLARLRQYAEVAMARLLRRIDETERRWRRRSGEQNWQEHNRQRSGVVLSYADLHAEVVRRLGQERVRAEFVAEWRRWPAQLDLRERSMRLVYRLWSLSDRQGPAVILFYTPPYYPAVAPVSGPLLDAVKTVMVAHPEVQLELRSYFPYLSDMSYLHLDAGTDLSMLIANMPAWQEERSIFPGAYRLPLTVIEDLNIPVVNWGPFGRGAHQRDEGVLMSYSFEALPQLLFETIHCLAE